MRPDLRVLVVGAGAVGKVLGAHLAAGGAAVSYLVRPSQLDGLRHGFVVYPLHESQGRRRPIEVPHVDALTTTQAVAARTWDMVVLGVSSTALRRGTWLAVLGAATGAATVLGIQPGLDDAALVATHFGVERVVWGMFGFMSYATDDLGEALPRAGIAYYRPPFATLPLGGSKARVDALTKVFAHGGLPSKAHPDVARALAFGGAVLDLLVVALECAGFRLAALRQDRALLGDAHQAIGEALTIAASVRGGRPTAALGWLRPWMIRLVLGAAPHLLPFALEPYLRRHYTKVADQTLAGLEHYVSLGRHGAFRHDALNRMLARLQLARTPLQRRAAS